MPTKELVKKESLNKLGSPHTSLFFPYNIICKWERDSKEYEFDIEVLDMMGRPDCKIGNFTPLNAWIRTPASQNINWHGYSSYSKLIQAVETVMKNNKFIPIGWVERENK